MRLLLLANPEASAYKRVKLDAVERQLADAHDVTMARTEERGCFPCRSLAPLAGVMIVAFALSSAFRPVRGGVVAGVPGPLGPVGWSGWHPGHGRVPMGDELLDFHGNEAYAPLLVMDYKHFLRLHIAAGGALTVYPIGVD